MESCSDNVKALYQPMPHTVALVLAWIVFPLIWVGGLVTTYDAGMAVPDWPGTYGYNLYLYPWTTWFYGPWNLFIEHGHRLLGATAGFVTILLVMVFYRFETRSFIKWLGLFSLGFIILQGLLGGLRVTLNARTIAMVHGCTGPAFFAFIAALCTLTSKSWLQAAQISNAESLSRSALIGLLLTYSQMILGAFLRHPVDDGSPGVFRVILYFHLILALALVGHIAGFVLQVRRYARANPWISMSAYTLALLAGLQIVLGVVTLILKYGWLSWLGGELFAPNYIVQAKDFSSAMIVTAHVANGSLILAQFAVLWVKCVRTCGTGWDNHLSYSFTSKGVLA
jgi:cytochrome c oxidase assembly protein subunit 15